MLRAIFLMTLGRVETGRRRFEAAASALHEARRILVVSQGPEHPRTAEVVRLLVQLPAT